MRVKLALENSTLPWNPNNSRLLGLSSVAPIVSFQLAGVSQSVLLTIYLIKGIVFQILGFLVSRI